VSVCICDVSLTDNLPVATKFLIDKKVHYESGYRLGYVNNGKVVFFTVPTVYNLLLYNLDLSSFSSPLSIL